MTSWVWLFRNKSSLLILYFVHPRFTCQTPKNPKILFSLHGAVTTSRVAWRNLFEHWSIQSALLAQMTKMPLVNLGLTEGQMRSKSSQNNTFKVFDQTWAFQRFVATVTKFDLKLILGGPKNSNFDLVVRMGSN